MAKAQAQEPSMEEILASIRRIIADEDAPAAASAKGAPATAPAETHVSEDDLDRLFSGAADDDEDDDVLKLGDDDKDQAAASVEEDDFDISFEPIAAPEPVVPPVKAKVEAPPKPKMPPPEVEARQPVYAQEQQATVEPILSHSTDTMVSAAFDNLAMTILNKNARTVEDLIQDMLRPMLRSWLDQNLPSLVERLVRAEIERVSRGR